MKIAVLLFFLLFIFAFSWVQPISKKQVGKQLAERNCTNCHSISKEKSVLSLKGIRKVRTKKWLYGFIKNPTKMIATDAEAKKLYEKWKPVVMTAFPYLDKNAIDAILDYYDSMPTK